MKDSMSDPRIINTVVPATASPLLEVRDLSVVFGSGDREMVAATVTGRQRVLHRLAHERVCEAEPVCAGIVDEPRLQLDITAHDFELLADRQRQRHILCERHRRRKHG